MSGQLKTKLAQWDQKSTDDLKQLYKQYYDADDFIDDLIQLCADVRYQVAASWLLKFAQDDGLCLDANQMAKFLSLYPDFEHWQSRLHWLQILPGFEIPVSLEQQVVISLRLGLSDENKFIRAWSYNGLHHITKQFPNYEAEFEAFFDAAMKDECASVKARIRQFRKSKD